MKTSDMETKLTAALWGWRPKEEGDASEIIARLLPVVREIVNDAISFELERVRVRDGDLLVVRANENYVVDKELEEQIAEFFHGMEKNVSVGVGLDVQRFTKGKMKALGWQRVEDEPDQ